MHKCESQDENWTHFRDNSHNGISLTAKASGKWSDESGFAWKAEIYGKGFSSSVIYFNQIWDTPAFLRNSIILRTDKYLGKIE